MTVDTGALSGTTNYRATNLWNNEKFDIDSQTGELEIKVPGRDALLLKIYTKDDGTGYEDEDQKPGGNEKPGEEKPGEDDDTKNPYASGKKKKSLTDRIWWIVMMILFLIVGSFYLTIKARPSILIDKFNKKDQER